MWTTRNADGGGMMQEKTRPAPGGSVIDDTYVIEGVIGAGSGGIVYRAWHRRLQKRVVLKKMKLPQSRIAENRRETDILKKLRHSSLPGVIDFIVVDGDVYTVMDYIEGRSLAEELGRGRRFSLEEAVRYVTQLLDALVYLHGQMPPVLHGDIKPGNIMLTPEGNICLIDFNISGYLTDHRFSVKGYTQGYAAPEQVRAVQYAMRTGRSAPPGAVDQRADLYSAGAVLFTLLTGYKPQGDWGHMRDLLERAGVSDGLVTVLSHALEEDPERRVSSAALMLEELGNYPKLEKRYRHKVIRRRILLFSALGAAAAALLLTAGLLRARQTAREKEYRQLLTRLETEVTGEGDGTEQAMDLYEACTGLFPDRLEPLARMAENLYRSGDYEGCIRLIRSDLVIPEGKTEDSVSCGEIWYLLGSAYLELGQVQEAVRAYATALEYHRDNPDFFRDYAIALARSGDTEAARRILEQAEENGLGESRILLAEGEILSGEGRYEEAVSALTRCVEASGDDEERLRAWLLADRAYEAMGITTDNMLRDADMLEQAGILLPEDKRGPVLERLAQAYIHLYDLTGNPSYAQQGIDVFDRIIQSGWATALTYNNIIVLYQKTGDLEAAAEYAGRMQERWPDNYRTGKRLAFLEEAIQEEREADLRDYSLFEAYYQRARELFVKEGGTEASDPEMGVLEELHSRLEQKGRL